MPKPERTLPPIELVLIQHGQGEDEAQHLRGGWLDLPLTPLGARQMEALARRLAGEGARFDALYASSLRRAAESAAILGRALGLAPALHDGLRAFHWGDLTGVADEGAEQPFSGAWDIPSDSHLPPAPNAETPVSFAARAWRALEAIMAGHPGGRVAVVTHGGVVRAAVRRWLGLHAWARDGALLACEPASVTRLRRTPDGRPQLVTFNDTAHLAALRE